LWESGDKEDIFIMDRTPLKTTMTELQLVGIKGEVTKNGRHPRIHWIANGHQRAVTVAISPSDPNAHKVAQRLVRKLLREDGILK
jgi:hypothetical protein